MLFADSVRFVQYLPPPVLAGGNANPYNS